MVYWQEIHRETVEGFEIVTCVTHEECSPEEHFDDDGETAAAIRDGALDWFSVRVQAMREGIALASEYLGCCCYRNARDFVTPDDDYYADMRASAIEQARATIAKIAA